MSCIGRQARSRNVGSRKKPTSPGNSASGSGAKRCTECSKSLRDTKETIRNGLLILRIRYGLPYSEMPDLEPSHLGRFHSFLLGQGKERASVPFPRRQRREENGLCQLQRLRRHERWELALSVASIKRNLPSGCSSHTPSARSDWESNAFSSSPPSNPEYLAFCKRIAAQIFRPGWDRDYHSFVRSHVPNATSREKRFSRADLLWAGRREEFFSSTTQEAELPSAFWARYKEVQTAGKKRPLVIYDDYVDLLAPLHRMVYSRLCEQDWLLCGPPTERRLASVCVNAVQTSVDLVAATDGLNHDVAETLLHTAFFSSLKIPRSLRALAIASLAPHVRGKGKCDVVKHGQMMGAYLSFPLLCLQSYCAARWAARFDEGARFLVNGDDCVISASRAVHSWEYPPGFRLNDQKTIRASNVVEVNSTVFLRSKDRWREVRHLRRGGFLPTYEGMMHAVKAVSRPCWVDAFVRSRIGRRWGFLPSQLGFTSYPAFQRERTMRSRRHFTPLPEVPNLRDDRLRMVCGRQASVHEKRVLEDFLWENGRGKAMKRDETGFTPGSVRRTYSYVSKPLWSSSSYDGWRMSGHGSRVKIPCFFLPLEEETEEEKSGLLLLDHWRQAFDSLV